ncbi:uncharacterized protein BX664DRAFT_276298 [Halteromyces radiatus]|uniref:uncharacterized protein n=1 Tax=Halteromyces radiatus TaxID=101107 RepID=UPI00221F6C81|nr:uncharacterized protein BX664DRAFT_276298 [Halteromyces radiatus]KAI8097519.1 hypothetical protein BX664DRAFT_276298 [Halteromyces radiatus]
MVTSKRKRKTVNLSTKKRPQRRTTATRALTEHDSDASSASDYEEKVDNNKESKNDVNTDNQSDNDDDVILTADDFNPPKIKVPVPKGSPFPDAISPASMTFMATLIENNDREFMKLHEEQWKATKKDFMDFVDLFAKELHQVDHTTLVQPAKEAIYRQHRDLRFTKDRIPYKTTLRASFTREGKTSPLPGYHISLKPGDESVVAIGVFQPQPDLKQRMRSGIMRQASLLREALSTEAIQDVFGKDNVGAGLLDQRDRLKVAPKGVAKDHPDIDLLRLNSLFIIKKFKDVDVVSEGFLDKVLDVCDALLPFVTILNSWMA